MKLHAQATQMLFLSALKISHCYIAPSYNNYCLFATSNFFETPGTYAIKSLQVCEIKKYLNNGSWQVCVAKKQTNFVSDQEVSVLVRQNNRILKSEDWFSDYIVRRKVSDNKYWHFCSLSREETLSEPQSESISRDDIVRVKS